MASRRWKAMMLEHGAPLALAVFLAANLVPQSVLVHHHPGGELPHVHPFGEIAVPGHHHHHADAAAPGDGRPALAVPADGDHVHFQAPYQTGARPGVPGLVPELARVRVSLPTVGTPPPTAPVASRSRAPPFPPSAAFEQID